MTSIIPSNYSSVLTDLVKDQAQQTTLWNQFIATLGLPVGYTQAQLSAALAGTTRLNSFVAYLQQIPSIIPPNYLAMLKSFVQDPVQQADLWDKFTSSLNIPAGSTLAQVLAESDTTAQFIGFLGQQFVSSANQILYSLSPNAVVQRAVLFNTFNLVINMLQTLQNTVAGEANSLTFFGKWQQEYTNLIAKVPIYTSQAQAAVPGNIAQNLGSVNFGTRPGAVYVPNSWSASDIASGDLSKLSLVYGGFDLADVVNSLAAQAVLAQNAGSGTTTPGVFSVSTPPYDFAFDSRGFYSADGPSLGGSTNHVEVSMTLTFVTNADGSGSFGLGFNVVGIGNGSQVNGQNNYIPFIAVPLQNGQSNIPNGTNFGQFGTTGNIPGAITSSWAAPSATAGSDGSTATTNLAASITSAVNNVFSRTSLTSSGTVAFEIGQYGGGGYPISGSNYYFIAPTAVGDPPSATGLVLNSYGLTSGQAPQIAWQPNTVSTTDTAQTTYTAQKNAKLQQYIQTLQSYKQVVANQAQAQQSALDSTKEAITQQVDLLNSIIQALQTIVASIFK